MSLSPPIDAALTACQPNRMYSKPKVSRKLHPRLLYDIKSADFE